MSDDLMDARLAEAGARWRTANPDPATVDFDALGPVSDGGVPFELLSQDEPGARRRRLWPWLTAAAAAAVLAVGITVIARPAEDRNTGTAASAAPPYGAWRLASFGNDDGTGMKTITETVQGVLAYLEITPGAEPNGDGSHVVADLGCSTTAGSVDVFHNPDADSGGLTFGDLATTEAACSPGTSARSQLEAALQAVYVPRSGGSPHPALWSYDGTHLVVTAAPVTLTYVRSVSPDRAASPALLGTSWTLANFTPAGDDTAAAVRGGEIAFAADGSVQGDDGCNHFGSANVGKKTTIRGSAAQANGDANGTVAFGEITMTTMGCIDHALGAQLALFDKIVMDAGQPVKWTIYGSGKLALRRDGVGTLVFVRSY